MDDNLIAEILAAHAERLAAGQRGEAESFLALFPSEAAELEPLLRLAEQVAIFFRRVHRPDPAFRAELKRDLLARQRQQQESFWSRNGGRKTLAAVGVGGAAVAVAGLIAYWRVRHPSPPAA